MFLRKPWKVIPFEPSGPARYLPYDPQVWQTVFGDAASPKLKLTEVGKYSIARPAMAQELATFILEHCASSSEASELVVTESNGGLGGFTLELARHFGKVQTVEILPEHCEVIRHNLGLLDPEALKRVQIINKDFLNTDLMQDIIVADPPWGGPSYVRHGSIQLGINNVNIVHIINQIFQRGRARWFVLLAPKNYDFGFLLNHIEPRNVLIHRVGKHYFVLISKDGN